MTGACRVCYFTRRVISKLVAQPFYFSSFSRNKNLKVNNFIDRYLDLEYNIEKYNRGLQREDKIQMIVLEGHELVTSHALTVLKPYVGEAHLISSILVLARLLELERFSFFGSEKVYQRLKKLLFPNVCVEFWQESLEVVFIDVTAIKKHFVDLGHFKAWIEALHANKKILLYELFAEGSLLFDLSNFILIADEIFRVES